jgi:hypothetical protein
MASRERSSKKGAAVVPAPLMPCQGLHTQPCQLFGKAEAMQNARSVGADLEAGPYLGQRFRLFVHVDIDACTQQ